MQGPRDSSSLVEANRLEALRQGDQIALFDSQVDKRLAELRIAGLLQTAASSQAQRIFRLFTAGMAGARIFMDLLMI